MCANSLFDYLLNPQQGFLNVILKIFGKVFFEVCYNLVIYIQREKRKDENDLPHWWNVWFFPFYLLGLKSNSNINWLKWKANTKRNTWLVNQTLGATLAGPTGYDMLTLYSTISAGSEILSYYSVLFYKIILCVYFSCAGSSRPRGHSPVVSGRGCSPGAVCGRPVDWLLLAEQGLQAHGLSRGGSGAPQ